MLKMMGIYQFYLTIPGRMTFISVLAVCLLTNSHMFVFGQNIQFDAKTASDDVMEGLPFMIGGRDFYRKYVRQGRPVLFQGASKNWIVDKTSQDISALESKFDKEIFSASVGTDNQGSNSGDNLSLPLADWFEKMKSEKVEVDLDISKSKMLEDIYVPFMLHCKEYKIAYDKLQLSIVSDSFNGHPKQTLDEMLYFSFGVDSRVSLYDSKYSSELQEGADVKKRIVFMLQQGDILYVPKFWWFHIQTTGNLSMAIKIPFNVKLKSQTIHGQKIPADETEIMDFHRLQLQKLPEEINCTSHVQTLRQVLKINETDPKTLQLRIPKKAVRPNDVMLPSGYKMPVLGLGTALLNEKTTEVVKQALELGYRLIDTAQGYPGSEVGIAQAMLESTVPRSEIFIVTKLHPRFLGYDSTLKAIDMSLRMLNIDYLDLFLIHSKECDDFLLKCNEGEPVGTWQESWAAMEQAHKEGKIRSLGVSNFNARDLKALQEIAKFPISVVQNWFDPLHQDGVVRKFCRKNSIRYMGYSTLGGMWTAMGVDENPILTSSLLTDLSTHYDYFVSSLVLRWAIHKNVTVIPRSSSRNHLAQNLRALDMSISKIDIEEIDSMANILDDVLKDLEKEEQKNERAASGASEADHETENTSNGHFSDGSDDAKSRSVIEDGEGEKSDEKGSQEVVFDSEGGSDEHPGHNKGGSQSNSPSNAEAQRHTAELKKLFIKNED